ncbi:hypothetical protein ACFVAJ_17195 [Agromyces sp. NPDC057679]|uniref:hypothetical protein n=1 Tax=Agromyces sp. NPDC057679 TaxID=3346207 RepID=UPI00366C1EF1
MDSADPRTIAEKTYAGWKNPNPWPRDWPDSPESREVIISLLAAAVTAERDRIHSEVRSMACYGPNPAEMEFDVGPFARTQVLDVIRSDESEAKPRRERRTRPTRAIATTSEEHRNA